MRPAISCYIVPAYGNRCRRRNSNIACAWIAGQARDTGRIAPALSVLLWANFFSRREALVPLQASGLRNPRSSPDVRIGLYA